MNMKHTRLIKIVVVRILDRILIFIRLYPICHFINEAHTIWAGRFSVVFLFK